jgi:hypothetical protein
MDEQQQREPGSRASQEAQKRRRRSDEGLAAEARLPIPPEVKARLEREGRIPRWVNDQGNRMHRFTMQDDYDPVEGVPPVPVGVGKDGAPILAHLLSKPREFIEEDKAKAEERRREREEALFRQPDDQAAGRGKNPNPGTAERYIAPETTFRRGNQILEG